MAIRYKLIARPDFRKDAEKGSKLYYAQGLSNGDVSFDELCESIAEESALSSADVKGCLDRMTRLLTANLREGRNVQLGDLGSFRLSIASSGAADEDSFSTALMKKPRVIFTPGKRLQDMREDVQYSRVKTTTTTSTEDSGTTDEGDDVPDEL